MSILVHTWESPQTNPEGEPQAFYLFQILLSAFKLFSKAAVQVHIPTRRVSHQDSRLHVSIGLIAQKQHTSFLFSFALC